MFKIFDKNGDGSISSAEMQSLMQTFGENITDAEANEFIKEADTSGDGRFTFEEFKAFMKWSAWFSEFWFSLIVIPFAKRKFRSALERFEIFF